MKTESNRQSIERRDINADVEIRQSGSVEVRKNDDGKAIGLRGYAAVFNSESEDFGGWREVIEPGAFSADLKDGKDVRALIDHDTGRVIGRRSAGTLALKEDKKGLAVDIDLPDTTDARDLMANVEAGNIDQMSFGFRTRNAIWEEKEDYDVRHLKDVELLEVSVVAFPAYAATTIGKRSHTQFLDTLNTEGKGCRSIALMRRRLNLRKR